jgi:hypothetical protein
MLNPSYNMYCMLRNSEERAVKIGRVTKYPDVPDKEL